MLCYILEYSYKGRSLIKYASIIHTILKGSMNTVQTQPSCEGKFSVVVVVILLFTFRNVNKKIKTTTLTENLPTQPGCVFGIRTDILSNIVVFVK